MATMELQVDDDVAQGRGLPSLARKIIEHLDVLPDLKALSRFGLSQEVHCHPKSLDPYLRQPEMQRRMFKRGSAWVFASPVTAAWFQRGGASQIDEAQWKAFKKTFAQEAAA